jgi:hypothetical protein
MPDHIHLFLQGDQKFDLGIWICGLKRAVLPERNCWQPGFFDHVLRSEKSYAQNWEYVRDNPVRAGLVERAEWPFQEEIVLIDRVGFAATKNFPAGDGGLYRRGRSSVVEGLIVEGKIGEDDAD